MRKDLFDALGNIADVLNAHINTEWADENVAIYDSFADLLENLYDRKLLTADQFDSLAVIAFYDYDNLKRSYDD